MSAPKRIQRKRTKGWRMPAGAVYVGRPSVWGNRYTVGNPADGLGVVATAQEAVEGFRHMWSRPHQLGYIRERLRGKDLACWCPLDQPCHADVLLEIANSAPAAHLITQFDLDQALDLKEFTLAFTGRFEGGDVVFVAEEVMPGHRRLHLVTNVTDRDAIFPWLDEYAKAHAAVNRQKQATDFPFCPHS